MFSSFLVLDLKKLSCREGQKLYRQNWECLLLSQDSVKMRQSLQGLQNKTIASESDDLVDYLFISFL